MSERKSDGESASPARGLFSAMKPKSIFDWLSGVAIPVVLFYFAQHFEERHQQATAQDQLITHAIEAVKYLASGRPEDYPIGVQIAQIMQNQELGVPPMVVQLMTRDGIQSAVAPPAPHPPSAAAPAPTAAPAPMAAPATSSQQVAQQTALSIINRLPRVFIHVPSEALAKETQERQVPAVSQLSLRGSAVTVPPIRVVAPADFPAENTLKYAKLADAAEAQTLLADLQPIFGPLRLVSQTDKYDKAANVLPRTYELWIRGAAAR